MLSRKWIMLSVIATLGFLVVGFVALINSAGSRGPQCAPPQEGFTKADLVGTWIAGSPDQRDTLVINADGTYKQMIHIEFSDLPPVNYESGWQTWWLEYEGISVPVIHLEGYRLCGYNSDISCEVPGGSGIHMCQIGYKDIPSEGVLYVMGKSEVTLTLPLGLEESWGYWREP